MTTPTDCMPDPWQLRREPAPEHEPIDLRPASVYEAITRQMVESLAEELREIKGRLNGLIFMMIGTILLDILSRTLAP